MYRRGTRLRGLHPPCPPYQDAELPAPMPGVTDTEDPPVSAQDLIQDCLEQLRGAASVGAVRRVADDRGTALLATPGAAFEFVAAILDSIEPDRAPFLKMFEILVRDARIDDEDRGRRGGEFLDEAGTAIELILGTGASTRPRPTA